MYPETQRKRRKWKRILFWMPIVFASLVVVAIAGFRYLTAKPASPSEILTAVVAIDPETPDRMLQQYRAANLAILGRDDLVRTSKIEPGFVAVPPDASAINFDFDFQAWQTVFAEVAAKERLVMIMEGHLLSEHRSFIAATLQTFADASFTHYSAEAISEPAFMLRYRGYANHQSGVYTSDPAFGYLIRVALDEKLAVAGYDFRPFDHNTREDYSAKTLAKVLSKKPSNKLLVHAGPGHVMKHRPEHGPSWLAFRLWDLSNIEPFTIYQISDLHSPTHDFLSAKVAEQRPFFLEPIVWRPSQEQTEAMRNAGFDIPPVDLIVIHPPGNQGGAAGRTSYLPNMKLINGSWVLTTEPVVVSAYAKGEPVDAVPVDQCMLQKGESDFRLLVPENVEYEIRVFNTAGQIRSADKYLIIAN